MLETMQQWVVGIGDQYGVNPVIFGTLYFGSIPFFTLSVAWLVRNFRRKESIIMPLLSTGICFTSAYIYLLFTGHNVPIWVYILIAIIISLGVYSTYRKIQTHVSDKSS